MKLKANGPIMTPHPARPLAMAHYGPFARASIRSATREGEGAKKAAATSCVYETNTHSQSVNQPVNDRK
jgi:hypothetical protein